MLILLEALCTKLMFENDKNKSGVEENTRLGTRLAKNRAVIGGGDGNLKL